jgi:hypothetical protein
LLDATVPMSGYGDSPASVSANLSGTTGAFRQYHDAACSDDHFVFVCNDDARSDWNTFFASALLGPPTVP